MTTSLTAVPSVVEPRVSKYPPYRYSNADDAIDVAEMFGLTLDSWQCMVLQHAMGERADGKWSAFETGLVVGRQQGKGAILEARALAGLFLLEEELILWSAHESRTSIELFRRLKNRVRQTGTRIDDTHYDVDGITDKTIRVKIINSHGEEGFERLDTNQRIQFIARSKNAGRGFSADCLIWDEAYALVEDQVDAQMPVLLARPNPQLWYASSPPLDAMSGAQLFRLRRRALDEAPGDDLAYFEWGCEGSLDDLTGIDLDDREMWSRVLPAYGGGRVTDEGVMRLRKAMSKAGFAREVLCIWPPDLGGGYVIPEQAWNDAKEEMQPRVMPVAFAVEVTLDRKWACIAAASKRPDGKRQVAVIDHAAGTDWIADRLVELVGRWKPCAVVVAGGGPAGTLIPELEAAGIEVMTPSLTQFAQAAGGFYDGICGADPDVKHLGEEPLNAAVAGAVKRILPDGAWTWGRLKSSVDISPLMAVTLALYGHAARAHLYDEYDILSSVC